MDDQIRLRRLRRLTARQREVLSLRCQKRSLDEIAQELVVSLSNVKYLIGKVYEHLELDQLSQGVRPIELAHYCPLLGHLDRELPPPAQPEPNPGPTEEPPPGILAAILEDERALLASPRPDVVIYHGRPPEPSLQPQPRISRGMAITLMSGVVIIAALAGALAMSVLSRPAPTAPTVVSIVVTATPIPTSQPQAQVQPAATSVSTAAAPTIAVAAPTSTAVPATNTPPPPPTATRVPPTNTLPPPTPTAKPEAGAVLYQANWSNGNAGWSASSDWKFVNGTMVNTAANQWTPGIALAPYQAPSGDYAAEAEIQWVNGQGFGLIARVDEESEIELGNGYNAGVYLGDGAIIYKGAGGWTAPLGKRDFDPGKGWHTYRLEVKGNSIRLLIDGASMVQRNDNQFLTGASAGLWAVYAQVNVRSFKIIAL